MTPSPPARAGRLPRSLRALWRRTGVRLAAIQLLVVLIAFGVAGLMMASDIRALNEATLRREVLGETRSLQDEIRRFGEARLPATLDRRTRLWRGFDYGLETAAGAPIAGRLRPPPGALGWTEVAGRDAAGAPQLDLVYVQTTPSGRRLAVGKTLDAERRQTRLLVWRLVVAAACGGGLSLLVWGLSVRSTWRRLSLIADAARQVADGRLDVRIRDDSRHAPDDIDQVGAALNAMLDRIGGLIGELRRVTTDVAHDLRTPLTRMRQKLEALEEGGGLPAAERQVIAAAQADLTEVLRTFDALLQLADIEGHGPGERMAPVDLAELALRLAETFRPDVEAGGRRLQVAAAPARALGDPALIAQMLVNLIENGMRHTPPGATLTIATAEGPEGAELIVADDGPGVPADMRQAVLAPFFRLDPSRGSPGSGVGLAIVAAVAARHRAQLTLEDNRPGLKVRMVFPRMPAEGRRPGAVRGGAARSSVGL